MRRKKEKKAARTVNCPCREASDATYKLVSAACESLSSIFRTC
jgi:hypothetical protein